MKSDGKKGTKLTRRDLLALLRLRDRHGVFIRAGTAPGAAVVPVGKDPGNTSRSRISNLISKLRAACGGEAGSAKEATIAEFPASQQLPEFRCG